MNALHLGIFIGRFQPLHLGHVALIKQALSQCDTLLIAIGSADRARSFKNPWTFNERKTLIKAHFPNAPIHFAPIPDFFYSETAWIDAVRKAVATIIPTQTKTQISLFGYDKDISTYYLKEFPEWDYQALPNFKEINATEIRKDYFLDSCIRENDIPAETIIFLKKFQAHAEYNRIKEEACFVRSYRQSWSKSPYPPIFVTTDAIVTCQNHVLLIKRKFCPGKGLYAMPGGFIEENEWVQAGLIRELIEETKIAVDKPTLLSHLKTLRVFDYPDRSLIGRVITNVGHFALLGDFPHIAAADDALAAEWIPIAKLFSIRDQFHDDHYQILQIILGLLK